MNDEVSGGDAPTDVSPAADNPEPATAHPSTPGGATASGEPAEPGDAPAAGGPAEPGEASASDGRREPGDAPATSDAPELGDAPEPGDGPGAGPPEHRPPDFGPPEYGSPAPWYLAPDTVPPPRTGGRRLLVGFGIGGLVLVLLLCAVVVPSALGASATGNYRARGMGAATPSAFPTPPTRPVSAVEYQEILKQLDQSLAVLWNGLGGAAGSVTVAGGARTLSEAIEVGVSTLESVAPPPAVQDVHGRLTTALRDLDSEVTPLSQIYDGGKYCAGSTALGELSRGTSADLIRQAAKDLATADPSQPYTFGAFLPAPISGANRRLPNGQQIKKASGGLGQLKLANQGANDSVVTLAPQGSSTATVIVYVWAGGSTSVRGIRDGTYELYTSSGQDWDSNLRSFGVGCTTDKSQSTLAFTTTRSTYRIWTIKLHVSDTSAGGVAADPVDPASVPT